LLLVLNEIRHHQSEFQPLPVVIKHPLN
jgi:hypothetical protein